VVRSTQYPGYTILSVVDVWYTHRMESRTATRGDPQAQCEDCTKPAKTKGRCASHHWSWYRKQETDDLDRQCLIGWCTRVKVARGRCHSHHANLTHRAKRKGQWPITLATRPARLVTPVIPDDPTAPRACPDCPASLLISPVASERVAWVIHNPHCPRIRWSVTHDLRSPDIELPAGVDFLRHAIDINLVQS
jgi:hypothetical protein